MVAEKRWLTKTILLVDDDPLIRMAVVDMLEDLSHRVIEANSAKRALEILESEEVIDLLVTDYAMPGMTGAELAAIAHRDRPTLPVLLTTGYADLPNGQKTYLPLLSKPYDQAQLQAEIRRLLIGHRDFSKPRSARSKADEMRDVWTVQPGVSPTTLSTSGTRNWSPEFNAPGCYSHTKRGERRVAPIELECVTGTST